MIAWTPGAFRNIDHFLGSFIRLVGLIKHDISSWTEYNFRSLKLFFSYNHLEAFFITNNYCSKRHTLIFIVHQKREAIRIRSLCPLLISPKICRKESAPMDLCVNILYERFAFCSGSPLVHSSVLLLACFLRENCKTF